jgi:DNA-binding FrmR family transcriptional regulator
VHTVREKRKLLARVRRIRGQIEAVERALEEEELGCYEVLQTVAAARGAMNGLVAELIEDHVHMHVVPAEANVSGAQREAASELVAVVRSYLR